MYRSYLATVILAGAVIASPAAATEFTGGRAQAHVGWDRTTIEVDIDAEDEFNTYTFSGKGHKAGVNFGAEVGFDAALGETMIAGAYAGIEFATTKKSFEDLLSVKLGRNFTIGARLGAVVSERALLYVKGGYSNGRITLNYDGGGSDHENRGGIHFGLGGEMSLGAKMYARAEYVRTNYRKYEDLVYYGDIYAEGQAKGHRDQILVGFGTRF